MNVVCRADPCTPTRTNHKSRSRRPGHWGEVYDWSRSADEKASLAQLLHEHDRGAYGSHSERDTDQEITTVNPVAVFPRG